MANEKLEIYEQAQFGCKVGFGDVPAIVVIDLQRGETDPDRPQGSDLSSVIENTNKLVDIAHDKEIPVVWTRIMYRHPNPTEGPDELKLQKIPSLRDWTEGSEDVKFNDRVHIDDTDYFLHKRYASAFQKADTDLDNLLEDLGADTVILAGCSTSGCIRSTADDAMVRGYHTVVPETCVGDRSDEAHRSNLEDINAKYADVRPMEEVVQYLNQL